MRCRGAWPPGLRGGDGDGWRASCSHGPIRVPDLILMDMNLPILDGWEATQRIKAMPATQTIPVIALTAHAMSSDREKVLEVGCDDYHAKPVEFPRLLEQIEAILKRV